MSVKSADMAPSSIPKPMPVKKMPAITTTILIEKSTTTRPARKKTKAFSITTLLPNLSLSSPAASGPSNSPPKCAATTRPIDTLFNE